MTKVITPLLKGISECTGFQQLTLLAGSAPEAGSDDVTIQVVHYGTTKEVVPRDFTTFDKERFRTHVLTQFSRYLRATEGNCIDTTCPQSGSDIIGRR